MAARLRRVLLAAGPPGRRRRGRGGGAGERPAPAVVLGLWAVTVDNDYRSVLRASFADTVRFVLIGGTELTQGE